MSKILKPFKLAEVKVPAGAEINKITPGDSISTSRYTEGSTVGKKATSWLDDFTASFAEKKAEAPGAIASTALADGTPGIAETGTTQELDTAPAVTSTSPEDTAKLKSELSLGGKSADEAKKAWEDLVAAESKVAAKGETPQYTEAQIAETQKMAYARLKELADFGVKLADQLAEAQSEAEEMPEPEGEAAAAGGAPAGGEAPAGGGGGGTADLPDEQFMMLLGELLQDPRAEAVLSQMGGGGGGDMGGAAAAPTAAAPTDAAAVPEAEKMAAVVPETAATQAAALLKEAVSRSATKTKVVAA